MAESVVPVERGPPVGGLAPEFDARPRDSHDGIFSGMLEDPDGASAHGAARSNGNSSSPANSEDMGDDASAAHSQSDAEPAEHDDHDDDDSSSRPKAHSLGSSHALDRHDSCAPSEMAVSSAGNSVTFSISRSRNTTLNSTMRRKPLNNLMQSLLVRTANEGDGAQRGSAAGGLPSPQAAATAQQNTPTAGGRAGLFGSHALATMRRASTSTWVKQPYDLPELHAAAWYGDIEGIKDWFFRHRGKALPDLIYINHTIYPPDARQHSQASNHGLHAHFQEPTLPGQANTGPVPPPPPPPQHGQLPPQPAAPQQHAAGSIKPPVSQPHVVHATRQQHTSNSLANGQQLPLVASISTAAATLRALLRGEYLTHACHPVTIAAAHGNSRCLEVLLLGLRQREAEVKLTWSEPPSCLPPGCPWVTPLAAAALSGSGECVELLAQGIKSAYRGRSRGKAAMRDFSSWGCFNRLRPIVLAQSAEAVEKLLQQRTCAADEMAKLCESAALLAREQPEKLGIRNSHDGSAAHAPMLYLHGQQAAAAGLHVGPAAAAAAAAPPAAGRTPSAPALVPHLSHLTTAPPTMSTSALANGSGPPAAAAPAGFPNNGRAAKARELLLLRVRLFMDPTGRPLPISLRNYSPATEVALLTLTALLRAGLDPDCFLSAPEAPNHHDECNATLLTLLVTNYSKALTAAMSQFGSSGGAAAGGPTAGMGAVSGPRTSGGGAAAAAVLGPQDSEAELFGGGFGLGARQRPQEALDTLLSTLLDCGALVDKSPVIGRCLGGLVPRTKTEEVLPALDYSFQHGPQEVVVLLLQHSSIQPIGYRAHNADVAPRPSGSSALLAFGAKLQAWRQAQMWELPHWLQNGRHLDLMEGMIRFSLEVDPQYATSDLQWLIDFLEECMMVQQQEFDLNQLHLPGPADGFGHGPTRAGSLAMPGGSFGVAAAEGARLKDVEAAAGDIGPPPPGISSREGSVRQGAGLGQQPRSSGGGVAAPNGGRRSRVTPAPAAATETPLPPEDSDSDDDDDHDDDNNDWAAHNLIAVDEDPSLSTIHSLYRHTAEAISIIHQEAQEQQGASQLVGSGGREDGSGFELRSAMWGAMLRMVAQIAAVTLNPPRTHGSASDISVFVAAKAVNQLLYARDWTLRGGAGGGGAPGSEPGAAADVAKRESIRTRVDLELLKAIAKRHPHEAARLIHGLDLIQVELTDYNWDSVSMSLGQDFYAVMVDGPAAKIKGGLPATGGGGRGASAPAGNAGGGAPETPMSAAVTTPSTVNARNSSFDSGGYGDMDETLGRDDILQACIFCHMWSVLLHFLLVSISLPRYMRILQRRRASVYRLTAEAYVRQYGSIPLALVLGALLFLVGLLARCLLWVVRQLGNIMLTVLNGMEQRLQPAMNQMGRAMHEKLRLQAVEQGARVAMAHVKRLARNTTSSKTLNNIRSLPRYLSILRVLLDGDALAESWMGVTQHYGRKNNLELRHVTAPSAGGAGGGGVGKRTTRVVFSRVPLPYAAAMPAALLYRLAASPQVSGELFASPVMRAIITFRWQHFTRYFLLLQLFEHIVYTGIFITYAFTLSYDINLMAAVLGKALVTVRERDNCVLPPSGLQQILLVALGIMTITGLMQEWRQLMFFRLGWFQQPWNFLDAVSSTIMVTIIVLHEQCHTGEFWLRGLAAVEVVLLFLRLLYFAMADDRLGSFFRMVIEVIKDLSLFFVFLGTIFVGFGLALTVMQGSEIAMRSTFMQLFTMIFGDFQLALLQDAAAGSSGLDDLYRVFNSAYQIIVTIILLNLLIAIINDSYERVNDNESYESWRNKVTLIVEAESVLPYGLYKQMLERLACRDLYVIKPESASVGAGQEEGGSGADGGGRQRRSLQPPSRWSGRVGETKRFVMTLFDQLGAQQQVFQKRVLLLLNSRGANPMGQPSASHSGGLGLMEGAVSHHQPGRGAARPSTSAVPSGAIGGGRVSSVHLGALGGGMSGNMGLGGGGQAASMRRDNILEAVDQMLQDLQSETQKQFAGLQRQLQQLAAAQCQNNNAPQGGAPASLAAPALADLQKQLTEMQQQLAQLIAHQAPALATQQVHQLSGPNAAAGPQPTPHQQQQHQRPIDEALLGKVAEEASRLAVAKTLEALGLEPRPAGAAPLLLAATAAAGAHTGAAGVPAAAAESSALAGSGSGLPAEMAAQQVAPSAAAAREEAEPVSKQVCIRE